CARWAVVSATVSSDGPDLW
nr:immunoglobulin heavy chain junction region [Macaca mulatta]MOW32349.1 immunoglobulin heavy chain junction region [Macaca mulatta]MOW32384.1 immunoglobulin heavy chain junction region [Macaca mulatta]MOW32683.1 immunoglobulin heavy chain junction region [Macaca mulatta]MOW32784.1 immunoglobulin heavy chain junction region [Macaca mulatta]